MKKAKTTASSRSRKPGRRVVSARERIECADPKTTVKTTDVPVGALIPQPHGGALRNGGTNAGGTGRPPDAFKQFCRDLASSENVTTQLEKILKDDAHPQFMSALRWASENGYGKPTQTIEAGDRMSALLEHIVGASQ